MYEETRQESEVMEDLCWGPPGSDSTCKAESGSRAAQPGTSALCVPIGVCPVGIAALGLTEGLQGSLALGKEQISPQYGACYIF